MEWELEFEVMGDTLLLHVVTIVSMTYLEEQRLWNSQVEPVLNLKHEMKTLKTNIIHYMVCFHVLCNVIHVGKDFTILINSGHQCSSYMH